MKRNLKSLGVHDLTYEKFLRFIDEFCFKDEDEALNALMTEFSLNYYT